jgi:hypothetical protein
MRYQLDESDLLLICVGAVAPALLAVLWDSHEGWLPITNPLVIVLLIGACTYAAVLIRREWLDSLEAGSGSPHSPGAATAKRRNGGSPWRVSTIETAMLSMEIDLERGMLNGTVTAGGFSGAALSSLDVGDLLILRKQCLKFTDPSLTLIEAYLDQRFPNWRADGRRTFGGHRGRGPRGSPSMGREEAHRILGLTEGASANDIKAAYRRLIKVAHPDHGGSADAAARVNAAKDCLLGS